MSSKIFLIFALAISAIFAENDVGFKFLSSEIVPDVIPSPPTVLLEVKYPSGVKVNYGNELTPTEVKDVPYVSWKANPEDFYTLSLVDPDIPTRKNPQFAQIKNWLVVNIPGCNLTEGETIVEYIGAGPYKDTDFHRFVFLLFRQPFGKIDFSPEGKTSMTDQEGRRLFSIRNFAEKYSLEIYAGNFFQAQYDDYVPILIAQLHPELAIQS
ncbi:protein D3-like [Phlebotomus papatasi]|uniref:protein D3-like n=1 Tax=Phlebotomus papatasi TaxID=29031 RepID=UPI002484538F|nr:protein D3-like [Phlebotomus papatasi]